MLIWKADDTIVVLCSLLRSAPLVPLTQELFLSGATPVTLPHIDLTGPLPPVENSGSACPTCKLTMCTVLPTKSGC